MAHGREERKKRAVNKARAELGSLAERGVSMSGNAFSPVLLLKGDPSDEERAGAAPLAGADGAALRSALQALGYAPEDWAGLATWCDDGSSLNPELLREAVAALDPSTLIACDDAAAALVREAFADDLVILERLEEAMLAPGTCARVAGMRVMNLGGFAAALGDAKQKQVMWARLKQLPPLGEPY